MNRVFSKLYIAIIVAIISFLVLPPLSTATPLEVYPRLYATINGNVGLGLYPGLGIIESNGSVNELNRMTRAESQNSYSAFGITKNSNGDYWTSTGRRKLPPTRARASRSSASGRSPGTAARSSLACGAAPSPARRGAGPWPD